jgi:hypothetical protein
MPPHGSDTLQPCIATDSSPLTLTPRIWNVLPFWSTNVLPMTFMARLVDEVDLAARDTVATTGDPNAAPVAPDNVTVKALPPLPAVMSGIEKVFAAASAALHVSVPAVEV